MLKILLFIAWHETNEECSDPSFGCWIVVAVVDEWYVIFQNPFVHCNPLFRQHKIMCIRICYCLVLSVACDQIIWNTCHISLSSHQFKTRSPFAILYVIVDIWISLDHFNHFVLLVFIFDSFECNVTYLFAFISLPKDESFQWTPSCIIEMHVDSLNNFSITCENVDFQGKKLDPGHQASGSEII